MSLIFCCVLLYYLHYSADVKNLINGIIKKRNNRNESTTLWHKIVYTWATHKSMVSKGCFFIKEKSKREERLFDENLNYRRTCCQEVMKNFEREVLNNGVT